MKEIVKSFKALADETRLRILNLLLHRECCVCEVMQVLGISQTRASRNLNILLDAGFLKHRKEGLWALYSLDREAVAPYHQLLADAISEALDGNGIAAADLKRLEATERICPR